MSLRDYEKTLVCLDRFPPHSWPGGEDGYYAFHFDLLGARIGRGNECSKFCIQQILNIVASGFIGLILDLRIGGDSWHIARKRVDTVEFSYWW